MDYDENDFQNQNHHLASDGSNKFPPVLTPYALPKFDFDDSLQGHLRFDSLVETEAFLGIESNEDNRWIEDFSRGSCGIDFSKSAADSCSISRCNNVWSEATSSESVEMLLKSVGQEETVPRQNIDEVSDVFNELGCLTKRMEPDVSHDATFSEVGDVGDLQPAFSLQEVPDDSFRLTTDVGTTNSHAEISLETDRGEAVENSSGDVGLDTDGKSGLLAEGGLVDSEMCTDVSVRGASDLAVHSAEDHVEEDITCSEVKVDDALQNSDSIIVEDKLNIQEAPDPTNDASGKDETDATKSNSLLSEQLLPLENNEMNSENSDVDKQHIDSAEMNQQNSNVAAVESMASHLDGAANSDSCVETIQEENAERTVISTVEETLVLEEDADPVTVQESAEGAYGEATLQACEYQDVHLRDEGMSVQSNINVHMESQIVVEADKEIDGHPEEVVSPQHNVESCMQRDDIEKFKSVEDQVVSGELEDNPVVPSYSLEDEVGRGHADRDMTCDSVDVKMDILAADTMGSSKIEGTLEDSKVEDLGLSSAQAGILETEEVNEQGDAPNTDSVSVCQEDNTMLLPDLSIKDDMAGVPVDIDIKMDTLAADTMGSSKIEGTLEDSKVEDLGLSSAQAGILEIEEVNEQGDAPNTDSVSVCQEDNTMLLPDLSIKDDMSGVPVDIDKGFGVPPISESGNNEDVVSDKTEVNASADIVPQQISVCQEDNTMLLPDLSIKDDMAGAPVDIDKGFGVPPISESGNNEDAVSDKTEVNASADIVPQSTQLDTENGAEVESNRGDLPTQLPDSHVAVEGGSCSDRVEKAGCASDQQSLDTAAPECIQTLKTGNLGNLRESQTAEIIVSQECTSNLEVVVNLIDVTSKDNGCAEATITLERSGVSTPQEKCEMESELSGDASKVLESTLVSASSEGLQIESDALEDGRDLHDPNHTNSDTHVTSSNGTPSVGDKEKGESENFTVQDIGVSAAQEQPGKDGSHVPGQNEIDASKARKSLALQIGEASPSTPGPVQTASRVQRGGKRAAPRVADKENKSSKDTPDRKPRRASIKSAGRGSSKKRNIVKDECPVMHSELPARSSNVSLGPSGFYQFAQPNEILHHGQMEGLSTKPFGAHTNPPSSLPDLNSSAFPPVIFQQPFNDMQQVQLRAQILVYGSIISKEAPEELHMVSAFGGPDGGRSMWENAWRTCKARVSVQTPQPINLETPTASRPDMASDPASKQSKITPSPAGRPSTSGTPRPSINPMIPLSSPLWNLSTPSVDVLQSSALARGAVVDYQPAFPQLAPFQTQPIISYVGHGTTWMPQTSFRNPWAASLQTSAPNTSTQFPSLHTESVQLTPVRESSLAFSSGMKPPPPGPSAQSGVHPGPTVASPSPDLANVTVESGLPSGDPKSKKRKKGPPPEDQSRNTLQYQSHSEKSSLPATVSNVFASVTDTTPAGFLSKCTTLEFNAVASPTPSSAPPKEAEGKKKPVLSEEAISKVKEAKQQAEDASALAAAAVSHSQEIWNELDRKKVEGSVSVSEAKLASAVVAIAAAAAVAKAAAAAANVASNAALQAKAMADEALTAGDCSNLNPIEGNPSGGVGLNSSNSIIFAAKEAARRRVEAASAATLRAENLDIIVKAAELAAEAISQAGKVVTMGDLLSLGKLAEAGPEGFWKLPEFSSEQALEVRGASIEQANSGNLVVGSIGSKERLEGQPDNGAAHSNQHVPSPVTKEFLRSPMEDPVRLIVGISGTVSPGDKDQLGQKSPTISDTAKLTGVNPESQYELRSQNVGECGDSNNTEGGKRDYGIHEGSRVEVFKDGNGHKGSWFSADVISLKDGKAYVSYHELPSVEGSGKLEEWVDIESSGDKAPKIRIPHPMTAVQFDGSKKRRRAAIGSFTCAIGDRVDAWIRDSWWEGVVTEKSQKDETSVTVSFPVLGESSVVRSWHLRPCLIWDGGQWIEWSSTQGDNRSHHEGDTPKEKRAKVGSSGRQAKGKDKASKFVEVPDTGKPEGSELLALAAKEQVFNIGKSNVDEGKPDSRRTIRSGLRKQGTGVFGVPKPGKKRKFMDVSKHYVEDQSNSNAEVNDSVKLANYLMPRGTGPRGLRNAPKPDAKETEAAESKAKVPVSVRSRGVSGRTASQRYNSRTSGDSSVTDRLGRMKDFSGQVAKRNLVGTGSFSSSGAARGGPISFSSRAPPSDANTKKASAPKADSVNKEKPTSAGGELTKIEESNDSQTEPRRSNRRIQPTSRLLEGLQSSLIISKVPSSATKVPSSSHDKGPRSIRGGTKGNNHG